MNNLPKKFVERVSANVKKYQRIAETQQKADSAEADTVTLVKDILADNITDIRGFRDREALLRLADCY